MKIQNKIWYYLLALKGDIEEPPIVGKRFIVVYPYLKSFQQLHWKSKYPVKNILRHLWHAICIDSIASLFKSLILIKARHAIYLLSTVAISFITCNLSK